MKASSTASGVHERRRMQAPGLDDVRRILVELPAASWDRAEAVAESVAEWFPTADIKVEVARATATTRSVVIDGARDHGDRSLALELVDRALASLGFKIEAQTAAGSISFHPYASRAAAERDLPRRKRDALPGVIRGSWKILPIEPGSTEANPPRIGDLTPRERLMLEALGQIVEVLRADGNDPDCVSAMEGIIKALDDHGVGVGDVDKVLERRGAELAPRVRLMLEALSHIVREVRDGEDGGDPYNVLEILNNHGIAAGDVDKVLHTRAAGARSALSAEEHAALADVQRRIGRRWKSALRLAWETGNYRDIASADEHVPSVLQRLRNASYFGASGLVAYKSNPVQPSTEQQRVVIELSLAPGHAGYQARLPPEEQKRLGVTVPARRAFYGASERVAVKNVKTWLAEQGVACGRVTYRRLGY